MPDDAKSRTCVIQMETVTRTVVLLCVIVEDGRVKDAQEDRRDVTVFPRLPEVELRDGAIGVYFVTRRTLKLDLLDGQPALDFSRDEVSATQFAPGVELRSYDDMCRRYPADRERIGDALEMSNAKESASVRIARVPLSVSTGETKDKGSFFYLPSEPGDTVRGGGKVN